MATSIDEEPAKDAALKFVNEKRAEAKLGELELHGVASSIADLHCQEMAEKGFISHWGLNGFKPYQRYAANGLRHHVVEKGTCKFWVALAEGATAACTASE